LKRLLILAGLILVASQLSSQTNTVQPVHIVSVRFIGAGYSYEHPLGKETALYAEFLIHGGFGSNFLHGSYWIFAPAIRVEPRFYYNLEKRFDKNRKTIFNSANYLSFILEYQLPVSIGSDNVQSVNALTIAPMWGSRRTFLKHMVSEIGIGPGLILAESLDMTPIIKLDLKIGFAFKKN
jgi:hypothetical protein